jgi:hypothetical protein
MAAVFDTTLNPARLYITQIPRITMNGVPVAKLQPQRASGHIPQMREILADLSRDIAAVISTIPATIALHP